MASLIAALCVLAGSLFGYTPAKADIAPPEAPPGANILPGSEATQVRMLAETVTLSVSKTHPEGIQGQALVHAVFTMRNTGASDESMEVRFPLTFWNGLSDGWGNFPEITDITVKIDGRSVSTRKIYTENPSRFEDKPVPWAAFDVTFPAAKDVTVEVSYTGPGTGEFPNVAFRYILETGAGWKDTIGSVDIIVRLPYEASEHNVVYDPQTGFSATTPGSVISGHEVRWRYDNLEPTEADNLEVTLTMPEAWQKVLIERENVEKSPNDGEAWGRLGKAYKDVIGLRRGLRQDKGGQELLALSIEAYENCLSILPDDSLWHFGFAELLWNHFYFDIHWVEPNEYSVMVRALKELKTALDIDPDNQRALDLAQQINWSLPDVMSPPGENGFDFLALTATPTAKPTDIMPVYLTDTPVPEDTEVVAQLATLTPAPPTEPPADTIAPPATSTPLEPPATSTVQPSAVPASQDQDSDKSRLPFCGAALVIPVVLTWYRTRRATSR